MIRAFFASRHWWLFAYGGGAALLASLYYQVHFSVLINSWYGSFYNLLQEAAKHNVSELWEGIEAFLWLAIPYVLLATITGYATRLYGFAWRQAITMDYLPRWRTVTAEIEGASQRIQEDTARFARIVESLGLQIARAVMTLIAFIPILAGLSEKVIVPYVSAMPNSLVWLACAVSLGGMLVSWFVGAKLPMLEYNNEKAEAALRKELVHGEDDKVRYASVPVLVALFTGVRHNYYRLYLHYGYFDLWMNLYDQLMVVVPYVIMGPGLFTGAVTLGVLVQTSNAFSRVHTSFALFIHNWTTITELRSIHMRLAEFERNLVRHEQSTVPYECSASPKADSEYENLA